MNFKFLKTTFAGLIFSITLLGNVANAGLMYQAVDISTNMGDLGASYLPINSIDQSYLSQNYVSGVTDLATYLSSNPTHSRDGVKGNNYEGTWFASSVTGFADFDLGSVLSIDTWLYWGIGGADSTQNLRNITIFSDINADFSTATNLGTFEIGLNNDLSTLVGVDKVQFAATSARYFRVQVNSNWGQTRSTFSEVAFASNLGSVNVPEPSTLAIFALGMIGLASRRFKK